MCGARIFNPNPKISRSPVDTDHRLQVPMLNTWLKVVVCLTPLETTVFSKSVTADRYISDRAQNRLDDIENSIPWVPHHPWTCESSPQSPQTETYSTVNTARARCEDVTSECSRPQNVIQMIHFIFESMKYTYLILSKVSSTLRSHKRLSLS